MMSPGSVPASEGATELVSGGAPCLQHHHRAVSSTHFVYKAKRHSSSTDINFIRYSRAGEESASGCFGADHRRILFPPNQITTKRFPRVA